MSDNHDVPSADLVAALDGLSEAHLDAFIQATHGWADGSYLPTTRLYLAISALAASVRDARQVRPPREADFMVIDLADHLDDTGHTWGEQ